MSIEEVKLNLEEALTKAQSSYMTSISVDEQPFKPLTKLKRSDAFLAKNIRVVLSKRPAYRIHSFLEIYADKITLIKA